MKIALCLGGAASAQDDWARALDMFQPDFVAACNHVGTIWPGRLDAWVTLHPECLDGWRAVRSAKGYPDAARYLVHGDNIPDWMSLVEFRFPGQGDSGSSGLFTAKAALIDLGADRAVLAGIPLAAVPHFFDDEDWTDAVNFRRPWENLRREYQSRIRSMSGWTAQFLGAPSTDWLANGTPDAERPISKQEPVMTTSKLTKIAYETHPVPYERKRELNAQGFKVLDIRFKPKDERDEAAPSQSEDPPASDIDAVRAKYLEVVGKRPFHGWDITTLNSKIAEASPQDEIAANGLTRREITADLEAMQVEFDPADGIEDLAALRDLEREQRQ